MSEMIFDTTPSMPTFDIFNQVMSVNVAGLEGLVGAVIGIFVIMLISFKYEDWAKTLAPTYFILNSLGMLVNPIALIVSSIWFSISVWNNTGFRISQIPNLATSVGNAVMSPIRNTNSDYLYDKSISKKLKNIEKQEKLDNKILKAGYDESKKSIITGPRGNELAIFYEGKHNDRYEQALSRKNKLQKEKDELLMKEALKQQARNEITNKPFSNLQKQKQKFQEKQNKFMEELRSNKLKNSLNERKYYEKQQILKSKMDKTNLVIGSLKSQNIKLMNEIDSLNSKINSPFTRNEKAVYQGRVAGLSKAITSNKRKIQAYQMGLDKLIKRYQK